ncbi:MAG: gliding motility-associated C-terminal domain-containing protein [Saprospiraceae bacterium]|nr:gliding motility-associated C-terminal domain-containing protein [Saprospiraceae bacterium]
MTRIGLTFFISFFAFILAAQPPCDPPISGSVSVSGPVCPGGTVFITFTFDDDDLDVTYILAGVTYLEEDVDDGFTIEYVAFGSTTVTLVQAVDDDDDDGCVTVFNQTVAITVSTPLLSLNSNNPTCDQNNGSISASTSNGIAPYQYSLNGGNFQNSGNFTGLGAGTYSIVVQDAIGCTDEQTIVLSSPGAPSLSLTTQDPDCGQNNGSISASGSGGTPPYQYSLNGGNFQNSGNFTGLGPGNYTVTVRDAANCTAQQSATLSSPGAPSLSLTTQDPDCGQNNGSISASGSGGTPPYQYSLNGGNFQNSGNFTGLGPGNYTVTVRDAANCTAQQSATLSSPGAPSLSLTTQDPDCGQNNGSISASGSGGTPPYQYSLNGGNFQNSGNFTGLGPGNYTVTVRDAANCTAQQSATLSSPGAPSLSLTTQDPDCGQNNGSISASGSGGTPPYQYSLNGGNFQNSGNFTGLGPGNYTVTVRDAANCTAQQSATLSSPGAPSLSLTTQDPDCGQNNGSISASGSGGTPPYQYSLNGGNFQNNGNFTGLGPGNYTVTVRDANACINIESVALTNPGSNLPLAMLSANTLSGCRGTTFVLTGNLPSGTTGQWDSDEVEPPTSGTIWSLSNAPIGVTTITWTLSAPGCPNYSTAMLDINVLAPPIANPDGVFNVSDNSTAEAPVLLNDVFSLPVTASIVGTPTQGSAFFNAQNLLVYQPNVAGYGLDTVVYRICYPNCPNECDTTLALFRNIRADDPCVITGDTSNVFTNGLTPNGDGRNDFLVFRVVSVEDCAVNYAQSEIIIYNRWGDIVFEASPYNNDWGGKNRDKQDLPPGVYYFVLRVTLDKVYSQFGSVILIR